ncbi:hypothetical protein AAF712_001809 [Marasmius tenuissimus]|uniref:BTB domain-containing protein n=1 Tax=Marasmius tenuissimus TaxID=585030 RepID=A0ABR3ACD8_9AGAR
MHPARDDYFSQSESHSQAAGPIPDSLTRPSGSYFETTSSTHNGSQSNGNMPQRWTHSATVHTTSDSAEDISLPPTPHPLTPTPTSSSLESALLHPFAGQRVIASSSFSSSPSTGGLDDTDSEFLSPLVLQTPAQLSHLLHDDESTAPSSLHVAIFNRTAPQPILPFSSRSVLGDTTPTQPRHSRRQSESNADYTLAPPPPPYRSLPTASIATTARATPISTPLIARQGTGDEDYRSSSFLYSPRRCICQEQAAGSVPVVVQSLCPVHSHRNLRPFRSVLAQEGSSLTSSVGAAHISHRRENRNGQPRERAPHTTNLSTSSPGGFRNAANQRLQHSIPVPREDRLPSIDAHHKYDFEDATASFLVGNVRFNVHRYFLRRDSPHFRSLLDEAPNGPNGCYMVPGLDDPAAFETLLNFYYEMCDCDSEPLDSQKLFALLTIASKYGFANVERFAMGRFESVRSRRDIPAAMVLHWARELQINHWLRDAYTELCERHEPLSAEEGKWIGIEETVSIAQAREHLAARRTELLMNSRNHNTPSSGSAPHRVPSSPLHTQRVDQPPVEELARNGLRRRPSMMSITQPASPSEPTATLPPQSPPPVVEDSTNTELPRRVSASFLRSVQTHRAHDMSADENEDGTLVNVQPEEIARYSGAISRHELSPPPSISLEQPTPAYAHAQPLEDGNDHPFGTPQQNSSDNLSKVLQWRWQTEVHAEVDHILLTKR